jgi:hypothetical protein
MIPKGQLPCFAAKLMKYTFIAGRWVPPTCLQVRASVPVSAMTESPLLHLAQDLEWLGCELEYIGKKHAHEGFPQSGPTWDAFLEKQRGVMTTVDKIERELKGLIRFNPANLVGVNFPLAAALDAVTELLGAVDEIKQCSQVAVHELPAKVRDFTKMVSSYLGSEASVVR